MGTTVLSLYRGSHRVGRIVATEADKIYVPFGWRGDGTRRAVIWGHGGGGTYAIGPVEKVLMAALRTVWVCITAGGGTSNLHMWGHDTACTEYVAAADHAVSNYGVQSDKFIFWGGSMGGQSAFQTGLESPTRVACVGAAIPAIDPEYVRANNVLGEKTFIEATFGVGTVPSDKQTYSRGSDWEALDIPAEIWHSTDDPVTPSASTSTFLAAAPSVVGHSMGAVGHTYLGINTTEVADFLGLYI